jgi:hypothetical protein
VTEKRSRTFLPIAKKKKNGATTLNQTSISISVKNKIMTLSNATQHKDNQSARHSAQQ